MALPTIAGTLQVSEPAYVRKLRRKTDWGTDEDEQNARVRDAVEKLFRSQAEPEISMYLISTDEDLRRVALGLNAGRSSLKETVAFVAFLPQELSDLGIQITQTPGDLPCAYANNLHHDMTGTDAQLEKLCKTAIEKARAVGNCTKGMMKDVIDEATKEKCRTVIQEDHCLAEGCQA